MFLGNIIQYTKTWFQTLQESYVWRNKLLEKCLKAEEKEET